MKSKDILKVGRFEIPKQAYVVKFSNGEDMIIEYRTFKQIIEQLNANQDIMLNTIDNSMVNLNQIVSITPLEQELNPEGSLLKKIKKMKEDFAFESNKEEVKEE